MITVDQIRKLALSLPEAEEQTHFGLVSFAVRKKNFVVVQKGNTHAILFTNEPYAQTVAASNPTIFAQAYRFDKPIGVHADLTKATPAQLKPIVIEAWHNKAPKSIVKEFTE
jgi:hypothetical protein